MLRMVVLACALGLPGWAAAQDFPYAATGIEVKADDGTALGRVGQVTRNQHGRIVSAELPNEPASAPGAGDLVADLGQMHVPARYERGDALRGRQHTAENSAAGPARNSALR